MLGYVGCALAACVVLLEFRAVRQLLANTKRMDAVFRPLVPSDRAQGVAIRDLQRPLTLPLESRAMAGRVKVALMVLALVGANGSWTSDVPTLKGRVVGGDGTGGVWLGVVGEDAEAANWALIEGEYFEVPAPPGERASLVAIAKDRVPLVVSLPAGAQRRHVELRLAQGLALEGTARSDDGNPLRGAAIRISRGNVIVPDVLARISHQGP